MPSFFSYVLWLEYVFKHALLCRHKIYIITRREQILFLQVWGRKILCAFNFPAFVLGTKLLGRISLLLLPFNDHDSRLTWLRGCERLESLIYCSLCTTETCFRKFFWGKLKITKLHLYCSRTWEQENIRQESQNLLIKLVLNKFVCLKPLSKLINVKIKFYSSTSILKLTMHSYQQ